jgi:predicted Zn-dependent protease
MKEKRAGQQAIFNKKHAQELFRVNTSDSQLEESVTLAWAAVLARKNKLKQAETMLRPLADRPQATPNTLDLLAKVYAQQVMIREAQSLWLRAIQLDPDNTHFYRALIRCADFCKSRNRDKG